MIRDRRFMICVGMALLAVIGFANSPVLGDLAVGGFQVNPDPAQTDFASPDYTSGVVPSAFSTIVGSDMAPAFTGGDFTGTVHSRVWANSSGELAFEYWFDVVTPAPSSAIRSATIGGNWLSTTVTEVGSDGTGTSTGSWMDGDPFSLGRQDAASLGAPTIIWNSDLTSTGTTIGSSVPQSSAHFWYATNATTFSTTDLAVLDSGLIGKAAVYTVPTPGSVLLAVLGVGMVGWVRKRLA